MLIRLAAAASGLPSGHILTVALASRLCRQNYPRGNFTLSAYVGDFASSKSIQEPLLPNVAEGVAEAADFRKSVADKKIHGIRSSYHAISTLLDGCADNTIQSSIEANSLINALGILASAEPQVWIADLMRQMLSDLEKRFKAEVSPRIHDAVIDGFLRRDDVRRAEQWLTDMHSKPDDYAPTQEQWNIILGHAVSLHHTSAVHSILQTMRRSGCAATRFVYGSLIEDIGRGSEAPPSDLVLALIDEMEKDGISYDRSLQELLEGMHAEADLSELGHGVRTLDELARALPSNAPSKQKIDIQANGERDLARVVRAQGNTAAFRLYKKLRWRGFTATPKTLLSFLSSASEPSAVKQWESALQVKAGAPAWGCVIKNAVERGVLPVALTSYRRALDSGIRPTNAMIHPILRALCSGLLRPPSDATIDRAISLFRDFMRVHDETDPPDAATYNTLLRALASSPNTSKYYPTAVSLLEDMQARNVPMDSMTTTSLVIIFIRISSNVQDAFRAYESICRSKTQKCQLDAEGYVAVLSAFCDFATKLLGYPPTRLYMEIVKDMRMAGYPITGKAYTIILQQLAILGKRSPSLDESLARLVRRVHNFMTVDASLAPDVALWNQLMNTYQQCRCFAEALLVWDSLYISRQHDNATVSILLDTCGYSGSYGTASRIWTKLKTDKFPLNIRNWNNWLECLCRLGKVDEAMKVLCLEMGSDGMCAPNTESARIVIKFATHARKDTQVHKRLQLYQPELWTKLPQELRGRRKPI